MTRPGWRESVRKGLTEKIEKPDAPVCRRCAGQPHYEEAKRHGPVSRFGADGCAKDGSMRELKMKACGRSPEQIAPTERSPDGGEKEIQGKWIRRERWTDQPLGVPSKPRRIAEGEGFHAVRTAHGSGKGTHDRQLQAGLQGRQAGCAGNPG